MKLQQLRYVWEVARNNLNVTEAAGRLFASQPALSKQIRLLEDELGVPLFVRNGKHFSGLTPAGKSVVNLAGLMLAKADEIRRVAQEFNDPYHGTLAIATTHTQARYVLPPVVRRFMESYPGIRLTLQQGTPLQIAELAARGEVDIAIATESLELFEALAMLPCYRWRRCVLVPFGHPLSRETPLTLEAVARYPLVTYVFGFTGRSRLDEAFAQAGITPQVVLTAVDADVIKTYVRLGMGVGIVAHMAYDAEQDGDLVALDAGGLFGESVTKIGLRRDNFVRRCVYDFIEWFAPHLTRQRVDEAMRGREAEQEVFAGLDLPVR